ncbi:hypothetical protein RP726_00850 [Candidatus Methylospira mobilis]|uniref:hypothetical protein n=1 Tax=Candidatus Methylospira mobilis TaxID=1808979 RepID=UPI0028E8F1A0|nr:hypothetical protein [Candidatus Methylospira mobilis]WNV04977.1 hypothetical protein RP726_00850 [Candidatus Methylospira mobilis]
MNGKLSRINLVKQLLLEYKEITHADLINRGHGWRLACQIDFLRNKRKWPITTRLEAKTRIGFYSLPHGWKPPEMGDAK